MSITFSFIGDDETIELSSCWACEDAPRDECPECRGSGITSFVDDTHAVNMSNGNAYSVMRKLGIEGDYCGEIEASELASRSITARLRTSFGDDYMMTRLQQLNVLAAAAHQRGVQMITWG